MAAAGGLQQRLRVDCALVSGERRLVATTQEWRVSGLLPAAVYRPRADAGRGGWRGIDRANLLPLFNAKTPSNIPDGVFALAEGISGARQGSLWHAFC